MSKYLNKSQVIKKPAATCTKGIISSQNRAASEAGAQVLANGGNAVDAAIATSFTLGAVEPWMSGMGGGGYMMVLMAGETCPKVIDFGMRSSTNLNPKDYPLTKGTASDLFPWPTVLDDRNISGPHAIAVPGYVDGMRLAHETFAKKGWKELLQPAYEHAKKGLHVDWYAQMILSSAAKDLARFDKSKDTFLEGGLPKSSSWTALSHKYCDMTSLANTLKHLANAGPRDFYEGETAASIVKDIQAEGGVISMEDLANYQASIYDADVVEHKNGHFFVTPKLTAGPTFKHARELLKSAYGLEDTIEKSYLSYAKTLRHAYQDRLNNLGDEESAKGASCTTNFAVVDEAGNMVVVTQTLLSIFGSRLMLPNSGILMNNGIMWFDPEPGKPNSLGPNKRCLSNMCPIMGERNDGFQFALGASGGRKILPAVLQLSSFMMDFNLNLNQAFHTPRIDVSGGNQPVIADESLPKYILSELDSEMGCIPAPRTVYPYNFACPSAVSRLNLNNAGATEIMSAWSDSAKESDFNKE